MRNGIHVVQLSGTKVVRVLSLKFPNSKKYQFAFLISKIVLLTFLIYYSDNKGKLKNIPRDKHFLILRNSEGWETCS